MRHPAAVTITSLLSVLLFTLHWADDVARGIDRGDPSGFMAFVVLAAWLYAAIELRDRRAGLVIILVLAAVASAIPVLHMQGGVAGGRIAGSTGILFWAWTLFGLGVSAVLSMMLAVRGLWALRRAAGRPGA